MAGKINPTSRPGDEIKRVAGYSSETPIASEYSLNFQAEVAIREIYDTFGDVVEIAPDTFNKFGDNALVGTSPATLMTLPAGVLSETYVIGNDITHVSSSNASDSQNMIFKGHTVDGNGDFTEVNQIIELDGQNKVALETPLVRIERGENVNGTEIIGTVYVYEDGVITGGIPDDDSTVHLIIEPAEQRSTKLSFTTSSDTYLLITNIELGVYEKTDSNAVVRAKYRPKGSVFRTVLRSGVHSKGPAFLKELNPYLIVPPNSDVYFDAEADGTNTDVGGSIHGFVAKIKV